jgi:putative tryptophan/tyrosine transport system substrate-binding protein
MTGCIGRRQFIASLAGAALAFPLAARAQPGDPVRRIGVVMGLAESDPEAQPRIRALEQALAGLGWAKGRNLQIDYRWSAGNAERMRSSVKELLELRCDLLVTHTTPVTVAARREAGPVPIVFVQVSDPVAAGLVAGLARPGGNLTGFANFEFSLGGKWVELIKEIAPRTTRIAVLYNPDSAPFADNYLRPFAAAAASLSVEPVVAPVRDDAEIERAIAGLGREPGSGLAVMPDLFMALHRAPILALAGRHRVPALYPFRYFAADGGLMSYGIDVLDLFRRTGSYVDRILRGATPSDLPVQLPSKFELVINLKAAKALGLDLPPTLLARADEVIE